MKRELFIGMKYETSFITPAPKLNLSSWTFEQIKFLLHNWIEVADEYSSKK